MEFLYKAETLLKSSKTDVFAFFSDAQNLEKITPPWLEFKIISISTPTIEKGTLLDYALKIHGIPVRWTTLIEEWNPPHFFVDRQLKGPYSLWHHTHRFVDEGDKTRMIDEIRYQLPLGLLGEIFAGWLVHRDIRRIFDYRKQMILSSID